MTSDISDNGALCRCVVTNTAGNITSTAATLTVTARYALTVTSTGSGSVALNPPTGPYNSGTTVQLTATAAPGWTFAGWGGDLSGNTNPASILMDGNKTVTRDIYPKSVHPDGDFHRKWIGGP